MAQDQTYDPHRDYRDWHVAEADEFTLSTAQAARLLGLGSTEGVRRLVNKGSLPAAHAPGYNGRIRIPRWAVVGLAEDRGLWAGDAQAELHRRVGRLEEALALLLEAREHELEALQHQRRAAGAQSDVAESLQKANAVLAQALGRALVPDADEAVQHSS